MKYQVIESLFPALSCVIHKNLTYTEAKEIISKYDGYDEYTLYEIEEMPPNLKDIRKAKLAKINENR